MTLMNEDTPRTNAKAFDVLRVRGEELLGPTRDGVYTTSDFARILERELVAALERVRELEEENFELRNEASRKDWARGE